MLVVQLFGVSLTSCYYKFYTRLTVCFSHCLFWTNLHFTNTHTSQSFPFFRSSSHMSFIIRCSINSMSHCALKTSFIFLLLDLSDIKIYIFLREKNLMWNMWSMSVSYIKGERRKLRIIFLLLIYENINYKRVFQKLDTSQIPYKLLHIELAKFKFNEEFC